MTLPPAHAGRRLTRGSLRALFGPIRTRLALIVLIAAVPLLILSATIALQNFRLALNVTSQTVVRMRDTAAASHAAAASGAEQILQVLSQIVDLSDGRATVCHDVLARILPLQASRYMDLGAGDASGRLLCSAASAVPLAAPIDPALLARARARAGLALGPFQGGTAASQIVVPAVYPIPQGRSASGGFVYALLRVNRFCSMPAGLAGSMWLVDRTGHVTSVSDGGGAGMPPPSLLARLDAGNGFVAAHSPAGVPYDYASARLADGYRLVVATPALSDQAAAKDLLIRRFGQLGLLLLLGLAAVAVGTHLALVEPLTRLSQSVAAWRAGGDFHDDLPADPPTEVRSLATSFAEATQSLRQHAIRQVAAAEQQELLMKEIHHRVKNNLQIVASLLNLQAARIRQPEARAEFASARDRVRALATLHRHLYLQGEIHTIDMPAFLKELCGQLFEAMGETAGRRIQIGIEAGPLQMDSDQAVPLSLIVTEAVSNALKYAFPKGRAGTVTVRLTSDDRAATLIVEDDGVGIPAGRSETETGTRDGLGITLIRGFAKQLGASLSVEEAEGTRYTVQIPLRTV